MARFTFFLPPRLLAQVVALEEERAERPGVAALMREALRALVEVAASPPTALAPARPPTAVAVRTPKTTWLTPYADAWRDRLDGEMPCGKWAAALQKLEARHGDVGVLETFLGYLAAEDPRYLSPGAFLSRYGVYAGSRTGAPPQVRQAPASSPEAMRAMAFMATGKLT